LFVIAAVAAGVYFYYQQQRPMMTNRNSNFNINTNTNRGSNSNTSTDSSDETAPLSSLSDDDKHKLFHAAGAANDMVLFQRVMTRLGLFKSDGSPSDDYANFIGAHVGWLLRNSDFAQTVDTPEKARAYVNEHLDD
jgi:hypothetical protein